MLCITFVLKILKKKKFLDLFVNDGWPIYQDCLLAICPTFKQTYTLAGNTYNKRRYVKLSSINKTYQTRTPLPPCSYLTTLGCSKDSSCLSTATSRIVDSGIPSSSVCTRTLFRATKRPPFFKSRALYTFPYAPSPISATGSYCWVMLSLSIFFSHGEVLRGIPKCDERADISQRHYW